MIKCSIISKGNQIKFFFTFLVYILRPFFVCNLISRPKPELIFVRFYQSVGLHDLTATFLFRNLRICFQSEFSLVAVQFLFLLEFDLEFFVRSLITNRRVGLFKNASSLKKLNTPPAKVIIQK